MAQKKHHKTKRQQPSPKHKKQPAKTKKTTGIDYYAKIREYGKLLMKRLGDKEGISKHLNEDINKIESYFKQYDSIQLLGGIALYLIDNLPNLEKYYYADMSGNPLQLDEDAEVIAEYAYNFALSMPNDGKETPTDEVILDLRETLRGLVKTYAIIDMPLEDNAEQWIKWVIHSETISVRGDGYQAHTEEVFKELFSPHSQYFEQTFGFSTEDLFKFCTTIEDRVICKIGSQDAIYGAHKLWERWKEWEDKNGCDIDDFEAFKKRDFSNGIMTEFLKANPDVACPEDPSLCLLFEPDDYKGSNKIFWVVPQNAIEENILHALSCSFGCNGKFIEEGDYRGNVMNGYNIFEKPILIDDGKYYCFTPMLIHRNLFMIVEKLIMVDNKYYQKYYQANSSPISRDNYIERKVRSVLERMLPNANFHSSVYYKITEDGQEKKPELDILGISDKANYIIEVKAHELTYKDRVRIDGAKYKFVHSVGEASEQSNRAKTFVDNNDSPVFTSSEGEFHIDKTKPTYKIAVCFQHYSTLLGHFDKLVESGLMKEEYRNTWIVSLFDLMIFADFIESEDEFIHYLDMHNEIYRKGFTFNDEIDVLNGFINFDLEKQVSRLKGGQIAYGSKEIDEEYARDFKLDTKQ